jgi:putative membrane protein insertion efficiency factor
MLKLILLKILKAYKSFVSPFLPNACRFHPTCSEYMIEAVEKYGAFSGFYMGIKRLLRCHPFCRGGYDPVK